MSAAPSKRNSGNLRRDRECRSLFFVTPKPHSSGIQRRLESSTVRPHGAQEPAGSLHNVPMNTPTREEIDAKLAASEARMDARIARIETLIETMAQSQQEIKVQLKETTATVQAENKSTRTTMVITAVSAVITIVVGIAAFNATVLSNMVASFESGKNTASALSAAASALERQSQSKTEPAKN